MAQLSGSPIVGSGDDVAALKPAELPPGLVPGPALVPADSQLTYTGDVNGTQRWVSADLSVVQYRAAGRLLTFHAWKRTAVLNHTASDVPVQVAPATSGYFDWPSGTFTAPAHGGLPITVTFEGGDAAGSYRTSVRIVAGQSAEFTVPVTVTVSATGPVK